MYGLGEGAPDPIQTLIHDVLALPVLQPIEATVVNAAQPYVPTVAQGFLSGWWAENKTSVLLAAAGFGALYFLTRSHR